MKIKNTVLASFLLILASIAQAQAQKVEREVVRQRIPPPLTAKLPDLAIKSVVVLDPKLGKLKVLVKNEGTKSAPACLLVLTLPIPPDSSESYAQDWQPALAPGHEAWVKVQTGYAVAGRAFSVMTDANEKVTELSEKNNKMGGFMNKP